MGRRYFVIIVLLLLVPSLCGCVRRRMTVMSNPPGAAVYLDGKAIGRTPFSTNFTHYGQREFRIVKQGYETKTTIQPVKAPWYQWIGIDFVSEVLFPGKLTDHKYYQFDMQPETIVPGSEIVARAEEFRQTAHADGLPRIGGSTVVSPAPSAPAPEAGSIPLPTPNFAPIVPTETPTTPPSPPTNPQFFVPPVVQ